MSPYIKQQLNELLTTALHNAFPELSSAQCLQHHGLMTLDITLSNQSNLGDYQCNSAMKLAHLVSTNPRDCATRWCAQISVIGLIKEVNVAGPGFINIRLKETEIAKRLLQMHADPKLGVVAPHIQYQKMIVEFSSPNIAKQMHVGHLRGTIIGDCLARVFEFLGADVLRLNHVGDWGTQFGMLIAYVKRAHPAVLTGTESADLTALAAWYKASKKCFDDDESFKKQAQAEVVALQAHDSGSMAAWQLMCAISRENYQAIYDLLGVVLNERGESFYNPFLAEVIADLTAQGFVQISEGARCVFLDGFETRSGEPLPLIIQKSDGGYNYASTDLAALRYRVQHDQAKRIITLTDAGQSLHFTMFSTLAEKAGYLRDASGLPVRFDHVTFGLVLGADGKKIKTRAGDTEPLINLIHQAVEEAEKILSTRAHQLTPADMHEIAHTLGINAIKYADLSCNRVSDYQFSYERMLRFDGNTAAFLMYAYVRIMSIQRKIGHKDLSNTPLLLTHPSEQRLGLHLARFDEIIVQLAEDLLPHRLCEYLYQLAEHFNAFFRDCRVEGAPEELSRLLLSTITADVLLMGMHLLGLKPVDKM